eukprot:6381711-Prymnesium_polylepis.2
MTFARHLALKPYGVMATLWRHDTPHRPTATSPPHMGPPRNIDWVEGRYGMDEVMETDESYTT